ncbi:MAG: hypothetical protein OXQ31_14000 [Spirochaetaceae bacterium]|nr:hypothetical protein [Spirochaetaceae bacterium]
MLQFTPGRVDQASQQNGQVIARIDGRRPVRDLLGLDGEEVRYVGSSDGHGSVCDGQAIAFGRRLEIEKLFPIRSECPLQP